ncbi:unnamed protein product [Calicophoron daubneyi]|uniref:NADH dehydrogenase subunit 6 n=1 Tax=Calicophoron daubneyi TaxID=300641 RepID=A0AAV2T6Y2_CALDB
MFDLRSIPVLFLGLALIMIFVGLAAPNWICGSLFIECLSTDHFGALVCVIGLIFSAILALVIALIINLRSLCTRSPVENAESGIGHIVCVCGGASLLLIAVLVYIGFVGHDWSLFAITIGLVFIVQATVFILLIGRRIIHV